MFREMTRRAFLARLAGGVALTAFAPYAMRMAFAQNATTPDLAPATVPAVQPDPENVLRKTIPSTGGNIPAIGLGSWITFNVGNDTALRDECAAVMAAFLDEGGIMIDSSPMYGSAQDVIGYGLARLGLPKSVFSADKVWISGGDNGPGQISDSLKKWGVAQFDLLQVHNLLSWQDHLPILQRMKADGQLRYVGITTSHGRRSDDLADIMRREPLDFIQITYNPQDRMAEQQLLPLAQDRGIAVIINRPFQGGRLTEYLAGKPVPDFAADIGAQSWAQLILKFIISHPAVTCAIPATTRVNHVRENVRAAHGPMPDAALRARIAKAVAEA